MPNELKLAIAIEEGIAYVERNPATLTKLGEFVAANYGKVAALGLATLGLAGCKGKDNATKSADQGHPQIQKHPVTATTEVPGSGEDLGPGGNGSNSFKKPDVQTSAGPDGITVSTSLTEKQLPKSLPFTDLPAKTEMNRQFVSSNIDHIDLMADKDLYSKQDFGVLGKRDLRPVADVAPGSGASPGSVYAVALDKALRPVDVLEYVDPGTGTRYHEQYQFKYEKLLDSSGQTRTTVMDWKESSQTSSVGPQQKIGSSMNTLEGVTQYYYDAAGKCTEAQFFNGWSLSAPRNEWKPAIDMRFDGDKVSVSERDARSGQMTPFVTTHNANETKFIVHTKAAKLKFFDLLGPVQ